MEDLKKELDDLKQMARNWKRGYETWMEEGEDNEYVFLEFLQEIHDVAFPYIKRLYETEYIEEGEMRELVQYFLDQVEELKNGK